MTKKKTNKKLVDEWTLAHFIGGFFLALILLHFLRNTALVLFLGSIIIILWEIIESWVKVYECG